MKYKRFYADKSQIENKIISGEEFFHAINVLRLKEGNTICLFCNDNFDYICNIEYITKHGMNITLVDKIKNEANPAKNVTLFQALAKGEKLDFITQKTTELGVSKIVPFYSAFCDVKPNTSKTDRLQTIAINACKQCGRSKYPEVSPVVSFDEMCKSLKGYDLVLFANETEKSKKLSSSISDEKNIAIIVGAEGGFSEEEINKLASVNAKSVTLGKRILRTETAGLYMLSVLVDKLEI